MRIVGEKIAATMLAVGLAAGCSVESNPDIKVAPIPSATIDQLDSAYAEMPWIDPSLDQTSATLNILPEKLPELSKAQDKKALGAIALLEGQTREGEGMHGSGILVKDSKGVKLITAAHVVNAIDPNTLSIYDNAGQPILPKRFKSYISKPNPAQAIEKEDLAVVELQEPAKYAGRALLGRNIEADPVKPGEALFSRDYQGDHTMGSPAKYTLVAATSGTHSGEYRSGVEGNAQNGFISTVGNIMPDKNEDTVQPGSSGGGLLDSKLRVVGINTSITRGTVDCGTEIYSDTPPALVSYAQSKNMGITVQPKAPGADECTTGINIAWARSINKSSFAPKDNAAEYRVRFTY